MTILTAFAVAVLGATAALIIWSFFIGRATKVPESDLEIKLDAEAQEPDGPDKRAGGPQFRAEALRTAQDPAAEPAPRRRRRPGRHRHPRAGEPDGAPDLTGDPEH